MLTSLKLTYHLQLVSRVKYIQCYNLFTPKILVRKSFVTADIFSKTIFTNNIIPHQGLNRPMITSLQKNTVSMQLAKETFLNFCSHFEYLKYEHLDNDPIVIQAMKVCLTKENYLCNRAFQLALEVSYSKCAFTRNEVLSRFDKYVSFRNLLDRFDTISDFDQSTLYTTLQSMIIKKSYSTWELVVNQTPPANVSLKDLSPAFQNTLEQYKGLTTNRFPDLSINGIVYDCKNVKNIINTKNHVYIMPESIEAFKQFQQHINNLFKIITSNKNQTLFDTEFGRSITTMLNKTCMEFHIASNSETKHQIIESWNLYAIKLAEQRPPGFGIPIFVITKKPYVPDSLLSPEMDKVHIPEGHLDAVKAKKALIGIVEAYPKNFRNDICVATKGALGHVLPKDNDID